MTVLMERAMLGFNLTVRIEAARENLIVSIIDDTEVIDWHQETKDGRLALDMFYHPFAYGYQEAEVVG